jgi:hypothetical protein
VLVEMHKYWHVGARFSSSVHAFHTVPVPEDSPEAYVNALLGAYDMMCSVSCRCCRSRACWVAQGVVDCCGLHRSRSSLGQ